jgi:hypothetical protein
MTAIRLGVMSDLHLEFEPEYWQRIERSARRGDSSVAAEALRLRAELRQEPGHPAEGPDLRGVKAIGVDLLLLAGDIHVGVHAIAYAEAAASYHNCPSCVTVGNHVIRHMGLSAAQLRLKACLPQTSGLRKGAAILGHQSSFLPTGTALSLAADLSTASAAVGQYQSLANVSATLGSSLRKALGRASGLGSEEHAGRAKITKVTVAKEAGHSRTKLYAYPRVLERIEAFGGKPANTAHDVIASLRAENALLKRQKRQATDVAAAMLLRMRDLERRAARDVTRAKREARRPDPNHIVGNVLCFPGADNG